MRFTWCASATGVLLICTITSPAWIPRLLETVCETVANSLGLQAGDVIVQINNTPVSDAQQVKRMLESLSGKGQSRMIFERGGRMLYTDFSIR